MKRYELLRNYETPTQTIYAGSVKDVAEWTRVIPDMWGENFDVKKDWFREIKDTEESSKPFWDDEKVSDYAWKLHKKYLEGKSFSSASFMEDFKRGETERAINWEIVSFEKDGQIYKHSEYEDYITNKMNIFSVKRLSDGQVFSLGDTVSHFSDYYREDIKSFVKPNSLTDQMWFHPVSNPYIVKSLSNFNRLIEKPSCNEEAKTWMGPPSPFPPNEKKRVEAFVSNEFHSLYHHHNLYSSIPIPDEKYPAIRQAIEQILNS